jgi:L-proline amide hydrolase
MPHHYLLALTDFTSIHCAIPTVFYDQLGAGMPTHLPQHRDNIGLRTEQLFFHGLDNLLHLGIQNKYDMYGQSWGSNARPSFCFLFASQQPAGLKHLIFASGFADMRDWIHTLNLLLQECPQEIQDVVRKHEDEGTTDSKG